MSSSTKFGSVGAHAPAYAATRAANGSTAQEVSEEEESGEEDEESSDDDDESEQDEQVGVCHAVIRQHCMSDLQASAEQSDHQRWLAFSA